MWEIFHERRIRFLLFQIASKLLNKYEIEQVVEIFTVPERLHVTDFKHERSTFIITWYCMEYHILEFCKLQRHASIRVQPH